MTNTISLLTKSPEETEAIARTIAARIKGGEVIELVSDLGGGKTTFTRGIADALGSKDAVASPTFTISREYTGGRLHIYHFDFYRLTEPGIIADELAEVIGEESAIVIVEWAGIVHEVLPDERLQIRISIVAETERTLDITYPASKAYLLEELHDLSHQNR